MKNQGKTDKEVFIQEIFGPIAHEMAEEKLYEVEAKGKMMMPRDSYLKQQEQSILRNIDQQLSWIGECLRLASDVLRKNLDTLSAGRRQEIEQEIEKAFNGLMTELENPLQGDLTDSLQARLGLNNETLLWMYQVGHEAFTERRYQESHAVFFLLTILNALVSDYWTAFGMSQRHINREEEALYSFAMASILHPDKPLPRYHAADIYYHLGQIEDAKAELQELTRIVHGLKDPEWDKTVDTLRSKILVARKAS
ncbi:MAG: hypothetical protein FJZ58_04930 [Chlamydiae bacterium]|nr:hypothetical protein [Chlamydiota bacterium]